MTKSNSLENINLQFRNIMGNMGLDEEKQNKLTMKMDINRKIKTIVSMQTLEERKRKIGEFLARIESSNSLMCILSLHCSIENGNKTLFSLFMTQKGPQILLKTIRTMEGEYAQAIVDFIFMLLCKYDCEIPTLFEALLKRIVEINLKTPTLDKLLEYFIKRKEYESLFKSTTPLDCVCSTFFYHLVREEEPSWINLLKETDRKEYVEYVLSLRRGKEREVVLKKGCKSERLFEIIRIGEEKKLLDIMTSILEGVVFGGSKIKIVEDGSKGGSSGGMDGNKGGIDSLTIHSLTIHPTNTTPLTPIIHPTTTPPLITPPKKKPLKKFIKKTKPDKNYIQIEWNKVERKGTVFEELSPFEIPEEDLLPFEKKEIKIETRKTSTGVPKTESVFSDKKNYALNIALSRIKLSDSNLRDQILNLSPNCDLNLVKQLLLYFPTGEEIKQLSSLERDPIGRGESFFKECVSDIHKVSDSLYTLNFKHLLNSLDILDILPLFFKFYQTILSSPSLKGILSLVLSLGNTLNKGTPLGQTEAFSFNSLPKVLENKYIIDLIRKKINIPLFVSEFKVIYDIQRFSFESLSVDFNELILISQKIERLPEELEDKFKGVRNKFNEVVNLQSRVKEYFNEKINEEFNNNFLKVYESLCE